MPKIKFKRIAKNNNKRLKTNKKENKSKRNNQVLFETRPTHSIQSSNFGEPANPTATIKSFLEMGKIFLHLSHKTS